MSADPQILNTPPMNNPGCESCRAAIKEIAAHLEIGSSPSNLHLQHLLHHNQDDLIATVSRKSSSTSSSSSSSKSPAQQNTDHVVQQLQEVTAAAHHQQHIPAKLHSVVHSIVSERLDSQHRSQPPQHQSSLLSHSSVGAMETQLSTKLQEHLQHQTSSRSSAFNEEQRESIVNAVVAAVTGGASVDIDSASSVDSVATPPQMALEEDDFIEADTETIITAEMSKKLASQQSSRSSISSSEEDKDKRFQEEHHAPVLQVIQDVLDAAGRAVDRMTSNSSSSSSSSMRSVEVQDLKYEPAYPMQQFTSEFVPSVHSTTHPSSALLSLRVLSREIVSTEYLAAANLPTTTTITQPEVHSVLSRGDDANKSMMSWSELPSFVDMPSPPITTRAAALPTKVDSTAAERPGRAMTTTYTSYSPHAIPDSATASPTVLQRSASAVTRSFASSPLSGFNYSTVPVTTSLAQSPPVTTVVTPTTAGKTTVTASPTATVGTPMSTTTTATPVSTTYLPRSITTDTTAARSVPSTITKSLLGSGVLPASPIASPTAPITTPATVSTTAATVAPLKVVTPVHTAPTPISTAPTASPASPVATVLSRTVMPAPAYTSHQPLPTTTTVPSSVTYIPTSTTTMPASSYSTTTPHTTSTTVRPTSTTTTAPTTTTVPISASTTTKPRSVVTSQSPPVIAHTVVTRAMPTSITKMAPPTTVVSTTSPTPTTTYVSRAVPLTTSTPKAALPSYTPVTTTVKHPAATYAPSVTTNPITAYTPVNSPANESLGSQSQQPNTRDISSVKQSELDSYMTGAKIISAVNRVPDGVTMKSELPGVQQFPMMHFAPVEPPPAIRKVSERQVSAAPLSHRGQLPAPSVASRLSSVVEDKSSIIGTSVSHPSQVVMMQRGVSNTDAGSSVYSAATHEFDRTTHYSVISSQGTRHHQHHLGKKRAACCC